MGGRDWLCVGRDDRLPLRWVEERVDFPAAMPYTDIMERFDLAYVDEVVAFTDLVGGPIESPWAAQEALKAFADDFPLYSYRYPVAPDLQIQASQVDLDAAGPASICPSTVSGLAVEPSRSAPFAACEARVRTLLAILELDSRPSLWEDPARPTSRWIGHCRWRRLLLATGASARSLWATAILTVTQIRCWTRGSSWPSSRSAPRVCWLGPATRELRSSRLASRWSTLSAPMRPWVARHVTVCRRLGCWNES
jgi:hypothetical protein